MTQVHQVWLYGHSEECRLDEMIFSRVQPMKRDSRHRNCPRISVTRDYVVLRCNHGDCPAEVVVAVDEIASVFSLGKKAMAAALESGTGELVLPRAVISTYAATGELWRRE